MGYGGKYTQVKEGMRELLRVKQEVFIPLIHQVEGAQVDFRYALAKVSEGSQGKNSGKTPMPIFRHRTAKKLNLLVMAPLH